MWTELHHHLWNIDHQLLTSNVNFPTVKYGNVVHNVAVSGKKQVGLRDTPQTKVVKITLLTYDRTRSQLFKRWFVTASWSLANQNIAFPKIKICLTLMTQEHNLNTLSTKIYQTIP